MNKYGKALLREKNTLTDKENIELIARLVTYLQETSDEIKESYIEYLVSGADTGKEDFLAFCGHFDRFCVILDKFYENLSIYMSDLIEDLSKGESYLEEKYDLSELDIKIINFFTNSATCFFQKA